MTKWFDINCNYWGKKFFSCELCPQLENTLHGIFNSQPFPSFTFKNLIYSILNGEQGRLNKKMHYQKHWHRWVIFFLWLSGFWSLSKVYIFTNISFTTTYTHSSVFLFTLVFKFYFELDWYPAIISSKILLT